MKAHAYIRFVLKTRNAIKRSRNGTKAYRNKKPRIILERNIMPEINATLRSKLETVLLKNGPNLTIKKIDMYK